MLADYLSTLRDICCRCWDLFCQFMFREPKQTTTTPPKIKLKKFATSFWEIHSQPHTYFLFNFFLTSILKEKLFISQSGSNSNPTSVMQTTSRYMLAAFGVLLCLLPEVTCFYQSGLVLNFLCDSREMSPYVRDNPWDCSSYVVCHAGRAMPNQCPADKLFGGVGRNHKCLPASVVDHSRCHSKMFRKWK